MNLRSVIFCALIALAYAKDCPNVKRINSKLICYYSQTNEVDSCYCTHVVLPVNTNVKDIENLRKKLNGVKILLTVNEFNQGLVDTVKQNTIDGLELNLKNLKSKEDITDFISTVRTKFGNDLFLALSIPPKTELLAKYYDLKALTKTTDLFILQTAFLGAAKNVTFHPSRLSGVWDMQNTDSVVDLVTGLGAPLSRLAVTAPVQGFQFRLQDSSLTTPGSPALELKTITRKELCKLMKDEKEQSWTLERDQDQAGPYIFRGTDWIAFEDPTSLDIKAKYTRVRGLAGLALKDLSQDLSESSESTETLCSSILAAAHAGLSKQNRAPRGAVLRSLEREILETPNIGARLGRAAQGVNVSPYRITRVVDVQGHVHSIRKDTRTEFTCTRQGYFVHPQSCGRFYRCVKFDQLTDEFSVFEFDCPAGLAFDERVEVCVWPGSLPHGAPCQGSSEIAPVPRGRFKCPNQPGYYVDPENCRWFFACLDHGQSEMTAYEFRCPFGLVFDEQHLLCQWPWLVPSCGNGQGTGLELDSIEYFGGASKSTIVIGAQNVNNHLVGGAQVLDSYDGLGSLGSVVLGGYQGDINIYKNSLQSHGLNSGFDLYSGNDGAYLNSQNGQYDFGNAQNIDAAQSYNSQSGINLNLEGKLSDINSGLGNQGRSGEIHFGTATNGASLSSSEINLGLSGGKYTSVDNENSGYYEQGQGATSIDSAAGNYNQNNQESGFLDAGSKYQQNYNSAYKVQDSSANINNGEQLSNIQYYGNYGNAQGAILSNNNAYSGHKSDYQIVQSTPAHSTVQLEGGNSGTLNYHYNYANEAQFIEKPIVQTGANYGTHSYGTKLTHISDDIGKARYLNYAPKYYAVTPKTAIFDLKSIHQYQTPALQQAVHYQNYQTPVVQLQKVRTEGAKSHAYSTIHHQQQLNEKVQPIVYEQEVQQPLIYQQEVQQQKVFNEGAKSHYSTVQHYQTEEKVQPVVYEQKVQQPLIYQQEVQTDAAKSHSYSTVQHHQLEQKVQPIVYEQKVQPVVYEQKIQQPLIFQQEVQQQKVHEGAKSHSYSTVQHHQSEQKVQPVIYEQKVQQPIIYQQEVQLQKVQNEGAKSHSYSTIQHHQTEQKVHPVVYEQKVQQPTIYQQEVQNNGAQSHSYSTVQHHQTEQKVQPVVYEHKIEQPVVYEHKVQQPIIYQQEVQLQTVQNQGAQSHSYSTVQHHQTEQKVQPVVYEHKVEQPIIYQQEVQLQKIQNEGAQSHSYSTVQHHQTEQNVQPVAYEHKVEQPIIYQQEVQLQKVQNEGAQSHSYSTVQHHQTEQKVQPVVYEQKIEQPVVYEQKVQQPTIYQQEVQNGGAQSHSYSTVQHHQTEQKVQPVVYEQKIEQPVVYEQKVQQPIIYQQEVQLQKVQNEGAKSHSYSTIQHHQLKQKLQPVIYEQKIQPVVYEQKVLQPFNYQENILNEGAKSHSYNTVQHYQTENKLQPVVYKQEQQPIVYEQKVQQPVIYQQEVPKSHAYSTVHHQLEQKVQPVVYEQKVQQPLIYQQEVQQQKVLEGAKSHSYSTVQHHQTEQKVQIQQPTYQYQAPVVQYEQKVQPAVQPLIYKTESEGAKSHSYSSINHYHTPSVQYEQKIEQPVVVQQQVELKSPVVQQESTGYHYQAPTIQYEQKIQPIAVSTPRYEKVEVVPQIKQNAYSTSFSKHEQVHQPIVFKQEVQQPIVYKQEVQQPIVYEQKVQPTVYKTESESAKSHSFSQIHHYQTPNVQYEQKIEQPVQYQHVTVTPKYETVSVTPQFGTRYQEVNIPVVQQPAPFVSSTPRYETNSHNTIRHHISAPKEETQYFAGPVEPVTYEAKVPVIEPKFVQKIVQPLYTQPKQPSKIETIYYGKQVEHVKTVTAAPQIVQQNFNTPKPIIDTYYIAPTTKPKPVVYVSSTPKYSVFQEFVQPKQTFDSQKTVSVTTSRAYLPAKSSTTPKYDIFQEFVQPQQTYEVKRPNPTVISEYQYENPEYAHYESKLNFNSAQDLSYEYQPTKLPIKQTETVYYSTQKPFKTYQTPKPTFVSTPKQIVIKTEAPIGEYRYYDSRFDSATKTVPVETYQTDYILSTPKPTFVSTVAPIVKQTPTLRTKVVAINKLKTEDNNYYVSTPKQIYVSTPVVTQTEAPFGEYKYYDSRFDTSKDQYGGIEYTTSQARPVQRKKIVTTTQAPLETYQEYYDDQFDSQYIVTNKPTVTTYKPQNYVTTTLRPLRKKITTALPIYEENYNNDYVRTTLRPKTIVVKKKKIITTTASPVDYDEYLISTVKPSIKITPRPKSRTVVKVNDFHPFLTTKLGAQCTCVSNTVKLRKSKQKEQIQDYEIELPDNVPVTKITSSGPASYDDYNEPGVYVVGNSDSDYDYEPKKLVAVTKSPEVVIKSTTNQVQPAPTPIYSIRKKVTTYRPESSSFEPEIILSSTPATKIVDEIFVKSKEQKIAEAVNEGLSLVKSAIKGYVKDAVQEEVRNLDRVGPGGWRSRDETLQGSVDCQRAGLFRHPTQCNKFYACHWDCTKQRYTLHVFNCPVHLTFDATQGGCNWPSKGPACTDNTLLPSS